MQQLLCPTVEIFLSWGAKFSKQQSSEFEDWEENFCKWVIRYNNGRCNVHIQPWVSRAKCSSSEGNSTSSQSLVQSICHVPILQGVDCQLMLYWIFDKFYFMCVMRYTVRLMSSMMISDYRLTSFAEKMSLIKQKVVDIMDKLSAIFGEVKAFIEKQRDEYYNWFIKQGNFCSVFSFG